MKTLDTETLQLTLLNAVLLGTARVLLAGDALDALVVVVLGGGALLGLLARCCLKSSVSQRSPPSCNPVFVPEAGAACAGVFAQVPLRDPGSTRRSRDGGMLQCQGRKAVVVELVFV